MWKALSGLEDTMYNTRADTAEILAVIADQYGLLQLAVTGGCPPCSQ